MVVPGYDERTVSMLGPLLEGTLIVMAPPEREHLGNYCRWSRELRTIRYLHIQHPLTIEMEEQWFARIATSSTDVVWEIQREGRHIGSIGLEEIDWRHRRAGGGIWIGEVEEFGKGFGSEAMALRTRYAFRELGLHKVMPQSDMDNVASRRAAMRAGYRECGCYREHRYCEGAWHDVWLGEVLREDWEARQLNHQD
jgi:RimJ/RimL family protein N-acetyltransferase